MIEYIKSLPASDIDPNLPKMPYEKWLKKIVGDIVLKWEVNDCGEGGDRPADEPVAACVSVATPQWHCPAVYVSLIVSGDYQSIEPKGGARFWNGGVADFGVEPRHVNNLASLAAIVREVNNAAAPYRPPVLPAPSLQKVSKEELFAYVNSLDVHRLDPSLHSERFDQWFSRTAQWPIQEFINDIQNTCGSNKLTVRVYPAQIVDPEKRRPPADIMFNIGTWERGIEGEPQLYISFGGGVNAPRLKTLGELGQKLNSWDRAHAVHYPTKNSDSATISFNKNFPNTQLVLRKLRESGFRGSIDYFDDGSQPQKWIISFSPRVGVALVQQVIRTCLEYGTKDIGVILVPENSPHLFLRDVLVGGNAFGNYRVYAGDGLKRLLSPNLTQEDFERLAE